MITVYKYPLKLEDVARLVLPVGAKIRHVGMDENLPTAHSQNLCMWVEVNTEEKRTEVRKFRVMGTGHDQMLPSLMGMGFKFGFVGTAQCKPFVWHIYELL